MIDTHAHLNFSDFDDDLDEAIDRSFAKGVEKIVVVSSNVDTSKKSVQITLGHSDLFAAVGIHPEDISEGNNFSEITKLVKKEKVVAIGETGLDYYRLENEKEKVLQQNLLKKHIDLAQETNKPLIFHTRNADDDFLMTTQGLKHQAVVHCFTGNWSFASELLNRGFFISFTGIITFTKDQSLLEVVAKVPLEKMMVETDCPFLSPALYRGKRCEPYMVGEVIKRIAEIRELSFTEVEEKTTANAKLFFSL